LITCFIFYILYFTRTTWIEGPQHISIDAEHVESIAEPYDAGSIISHKLEPKIKLPSVATINFKSPREIVFHTRYRTRTSYHFKFENNGTVAIEYNWYSDPAGSQFRGSNKDNEFSQILNSRSITEYSREKLLANNRSRKYPYYICTINLHLYVLLFKNFKSFFAVIPRALFFQAKQL
jgi:hypothetical protein